MRIDFDKAAETRGIPGKFRGNPCTSVFVTPEIAAHCQGEGDNAVPAEIGWLLTRFQDGDRPAGVVTRPGSETGVNALLPVAGRMQALPLTGIGGMVSTWQFLARLPREEQDNPLARLVMGGIVTTFDSIIHNRAFTDARRKAAAWSFVLTGGSDRFVRDMDDESFVRIMETEMDRHALDSILPGHVLGRGAPADPEAAMAMIDPDLHRLVQPVSGQPRQVILSVFGLMAGVISRVSEAREDEVGIYQAGFDLVEALQAELPEHEESNLVDAMQSMVERAMSSVHADFECDVRLISRKGVDMTFIMSEHGLMVLTWPRARRRLIMEHEGFQLFGFTSADIPSLSESNRLREIVSGETRAVSAEMISQAV